LASALGTCIPAALAASKIQASPAYKIGTAAWSGGLVGESTTEARSGTGLGTGLRISNLFNFLADFLANFLANFLAHFLANFHGTAGIGYMIGYR
jgi:hypothetical protein